MTADPLASSIRPRGSAGTGTHAAGPRRRHRWAASSPARGATHSTVYSGDMGNSFARASRGIAGCDRLEGHGRGEPKPHRVRRIARAISLRRQSKSKSRVSASGAQSGEGDAVSRVPSWRPQPAIPRETARSARSHLIQCRASLTSDWLSDIRRACERGSPDASS